MAEEYVAGTSRDVGNGTPAVEERMPLHRRLAVYVLPQCANCAYAREVAASIAREYPHITVEVIDLTEAPAPEVVFATPTYLLDDRVWSLGNPSAQQIRATFERSAP